MKLLNILFVFCLLCSIGAAQNKKIIDNDAYASWTELDKPYLTNDGRYVQYIATKGETGNTTIVLKSVDNKWMIEPVIKGESFFMNDDKHFVIRSADTLYIYELGTNYVDRLKVLSYNIPQAPLQDVLLYQDAAHPNSLEIKDLSKNTTIDIPGVGKIEEYNYLPVRNGVIVKLKSELGKENVFDLKYIDIKSRKQVKIAIGKSFIQQVVDKNNKQLVYLVDAASGHKEIWRFFFDNGKNVLVKSEKELMEGHSFNFLSNFSADNGKIIVDIGTPYLKQNEQTKPSSLDLYIWTYKDAKLPGRSIYYSSSNSNSNEMLLSLNDGLLTKFNRVLDKYGNVPDPVTADSMSRREVSPSNKFAFYLDGDNYWSYEFATGIKRNLTGEISHDWFGPENGDYDAFIEKGGPQSWVAGEDAVIIRDEYDLWKISLNNNYAPVNITNGYGRTNKIKFYPIIPGRSSKDMASLPVFSSRHKIFLVAFDTRTKKNGFFYRDNITTPGNPVLLTMDNAMYWLPAPPMSYYKIISSSDHAPQKAKNADVYLVARSTASSSKNFFITKDFIKFTPITSNYPEKKYNWLSTELINWKTPEGISLQGILYKPENFDSTKVYPVIFYYYRKSSDNLNAYLQPRECPGCIIDIPSYVSRGYLVFTPDFYFKKGATGKNALSAVTSAAEYLSLRPYVNRKKLGIQGCSFSGFTTNYIVTHTNIFAAACSASGLFDMVSGYNSLNTGDVKQAQFEPGGPYQMGGTLWEVPQAYIENSAVFNADKLSTPFLIMHTTADFTIPMWNATEFFLAARRLKKKVWMLQYSGPGSNHSVEGMEGIDFNTRMRQFFDYYLKDSLPPKWMTMESFTGPKDIDGSLELDTTGTQP